MDGTLHTGSHPVIVSQDPVMVDRLVLLDSTWTEVVMEQMSAVRVLQLVEYSSEL